MAERKALKIPEKFQSKTLYSYSRINSFATCEYGYYLGYVLKKKGADNIFSYIGIAIHELLEKLQGREITNEQAVKEFDAKVFEGTEILGYKFVSEKAKKNLVESLTHFLNNYKPIDCKDFSNEFEFFTSIEGVVILGYIDLIAILHDGTVEVYDYKISTKYSKNKLDKHGLQLLLYAYALENEYNIKVNKVKWNMLKYASVTWQGKTTKREIFCQRNELVKSLRSELKKDLRNLDYNEIGIEMLLDIAEKHNDLTLLPESINLKYNISDGFVEYDITKKRIQALKDFVRTNVEKIEQLNQSDPDAWKAKEISLKDNFYCSQLCGYRSYCHYYENFMKKYADYL